MDILENVSLLPYNTFHMDVAAKQFAHATNTEALRELSSYGRKKNLPIFILGGGSNILLTRPVDALVIRNELLGIELSHEDDQFYYVKAGAGEVWHTFVLHCVNNGYAGTENLSLIPGSVGAGPMQNIGAYGVELKDIFHELEALHIEEGTVHRFSNADCKFGYRESVFKRELKNQFIITSVTFRLNKNAKLNTSYGAIEKELEAMGVHQPDIKDVSNAVIRIRSSKLPDPAVIGNAGSFFKNPVVTPSQFEQIRKSFPDVVSYPSGDDVKLAAGWLIEKCGWKGQRFGDAGVHAQQALVLVNFGKASGKEIFDLSQKIMDSVKETFGVTLEREVNIY
ncbi:MAG: UDP-N-acetylmuramate dehydrogenase [Bacteroidia bacterium]